MKKYIMLMMLILTGVFTWGYGRGDTNKGQLSKRYKL